MEQKKTLWIIAAVGVFLLVVLGGACIVYSPSKKSPQVIASSKPVTEKQSSSGWSNPPQTPSYQNNDFQRPDFNAPSTGKVNEMVVVSENTTVYDLNKNATPSTTETAPAQSTTIDLNALKRELTAEVAAAATNNAQPQSINITVTMPEKETPAPVIVTSDYYTGKVQETAPKAATPATPATTSKPVEKKETTTVASTKPVTTKPATTAKPAASTTSTATAKPAATTTAKPAAPKTVTRFWVQVAAYTNKKTAESAREILTSNKITSDIFTYQDAKGKLFYRVRVGPYTTKSEAEYWQAKINKIDDFKNSQSYVTSTTD